MKKILFSCVSGVNRLSDLRDMNIYRWTDRRDKIYRAKDQGGNAENLDLGHVSTFLYLVLVIILVFEHLKVFD